MTPTMWDNVGQTGTPNMPPYVQSPQTYFLYMIPKSKVVQIEEHPTGLVIGTPKVTHQFEVSPLLPCSTHS